MKTSQFLLIAAIALTIGLGIFYLKNHVLKNEALGDDAISKTSPADNKTAGEAFLAENAKKEGVTTTASGLQYIILTEGTGATPSASSNVTVHYEGTTINGKVFDSSYKRGEPATFPLNRVIAGWSAQSLPGELCHIARKPRAAGHCRVRKRRAGHPQDAGCERC